MIQTAPKPDRRFDVRAESARDVMVVTVSGELDALSAPRLGEAITKALGVPSTALVVDLLTLDFLSSAGMAVLVDGHRAAGAKQFCVVADGSLTYRPMKVVGLDRAMSLYRTLGAALDDIH